ncbi:MAG: hypothetical protein HYR72_19135 [Deltaproteobacteria bacterium]|nr:hypothetical protein [Deltaproteobacteria bacterium]MBI3386167.1 hypothetical protein [Deltaproteobacteria bacterium]
MTEIASAPFTSRRVDRFAEWLHAPAPRESTHPRFDVRRARPQEFDAIYDLVDETFGIKRSRAAYDWLYRRNPCGTARCLVAIDRASGQMVGNTSSWPWPMARGTQPVEGDLEGDTVTAKGWQRLGIDALRGEVARSHAWISHSVGMSWPNDIARAAGVKRGRSKRMLGPVPRSILLLNTKEFLTTRSWPGFAGAAAGMVADAAFDLWRKMFVRAQPGVAIQEVRRFDSSFDEVMQRCMAWHGFWSPHDAEFMNWRYLDHPTMSYAAFSLTVGGELVGYSVLKIEASGAMLMEFVAPSSPTHFAGALLLHLIKIARAAGCMCLRFSAAPNWHHRQLFRAAGFMPTRSSPVYLWPTGEAPGTGQLDLWQWVPGDMDDL